MKRSKYSYRKLRNDFREHYPLMSKEVIHWQPHSFSTIELWFKSGDKATYNDYDRKLHFMEGTWKHEDSGPSKSRRIIRHEQHEESALIFSENLSRKLKEVEMSQADLARELGVSKQVISNYVKGKRVPNRELMAEIAEILYMDISELTEQQKKD